ncbi:MAG: GNAT family N-acetyltransferase [Clostridia bacterium]|nr:GNAT family N-acetyltransferase [Clostridia bacterium]
MAKHFKTNNVIVRRFEMKDAEAACNNLFVDSSIEKAKISIKSAINEYYTDEPIWAVEDKQSKSLVGSIRVSNFSPKNKMCNISWIMSYKHWDNSFMKDALTQIFNFLFTKKGIELIECSYYEQDDNTSVILEEIGMTKEATLRDRRINEKTNKKENFVIYSINKQEFFETRSGELRIKPKKILNKKIS